MQISIQEVKEVMMAVKKIKVKCKKCGNEKIESKNGVYLLAKKLGEVVCQFCEKC